MACGPMRKMWWRWWWSFPQLFAPSGSVWSTQGNSHEIVVFFLLTCSTSVLFWGKFNVASLRSFIRTATLGLEYEGTFGGEGRERYHILPLLPFLDRRSPFWYSFFSTQPSAAVKKIATIFTRKIMITRSLAKIRRALPTLLFYSSPHLPILKFQAGDLVKISFNALLECRQRAC